MIQFRILCSSFLLCNVEGLPGPWESLRRQAAILAIGHTVRRQALMAMVRGRAVLVAVATALVGSVAASEASPDELAPLLVPSPPASESPSSEGLHLVEAMDRRAENLHERALSTPFTVACEGLDASTCGVNLANALSGTEAVLELEAGIYTHTSSFNIDRAVIVRAKNTGQAILDGENARQVMAISNGDGTVVQVEGLVIRKAAGSGVNIGGVGTVMIDSCIIHDNDSSFGGGGIDIYGGTVKIDKCNIHHNSGGYVRVCLWNT